MPFGSKDTYFVVSEVDDWRPADEDKDDDVGGSKGVVDLNGVDLFLCGDYEREMRELYKEK